MRLLECNPDGGFTPTENLPGNEDLEYAILSHTWGHEEVAFKDLVDSTDGYKAGYEKLRFCAKQAILDGLRYFWVDTCCIDKSNQVELNEAIISMFRWYRKAARCYVYLSDVSEQSEFPWERAFRDSRWFKRGWTLQELLAPASVEFFAREGQRLGDKKSLEQPIQEITRIATSALRGTDLSQFDVDERFKWAKSRKTTREEDWAYCLLGIFGVSMPVLYGEGRENAIRRLRREIHHAFLVLNKLPTADGTAFDSHAEGAGSTCHRDTRVDLPRQMWEWADQPADQPQAHAIFPDTPSLQLLCEAGEENADTLLAQAVRDAIAARGSGHRFERTEADENTVLRQGDFIAQDFRGQAPLRRLGHNFGTTILKGHSSVRQGDSYGEGDSF